MEEKERKEQEESSNAAWQALQRVREAEEKARLLVEEARQKSFPEILRKAGEEAEQLKREILSEARREAERIKSEIIQKAEAEAAAIKQQTEEEKQALLKQGEANFEEAVSKTAEKLRQLLTSREG
ncbi:MAG: hypothetical protein ACPLRX_07160 [Candidatus Saccharicenans sp.]